MVEGALEVLKAWKVKEKNITVRRVYGSFDLPFAAALAIKKDKPDAVIAIGCIVKGETKHDEYIAHARRARAYATFDMAHHSRLARHSHRQHARAGQSALERQDQPRRKSRRRRARSRTASGKHDPHHGLRDVRHDPCRP